MPLELLSYGARPDGIDVDWRFHWYGPHPRTRSMLMEPLRARKFDKPGTLEYILGKARLYRAIRDRVEPTYRLRRIFPGEVAPPEEALLPVLMRIVDVAGRLGALDRRREKGRIAASLEKLGVTHTQGEIGQLYHDLRRATEEAARDVAAPPPFRCGTPAMIDRSRP